MNGNEQRIEKQQNVLKVMEESFVMVPARMFRDVAERKITRSAFCLYCYLLFRQGKNHKYWGSIKDICQGTGLSSAQISRLLGELEVRGHIKRSRRMAATWETYCLTRVEGRKIVFRGGLIRDSFIDSTMARNSKSKQSSAEIHARKAASENDKDETLRLFNEAIPSDGTSEDARLDRVEREIDEIFNKP